MTKLILKMHKILWRKLGCSEKRAGAVAKKKVLVVSSNCLYQEGGMPGKNTARRTAARIGFVALATRVFGNSLSRLRGLTLGGYRLVI